MRGEGEGVIRRFKGTVSNTVDRACQVHFPLTQGKEKGKFLERFLKLFNPENEKSKFHNKESS